MQDLYVRAAIALIAGTILLSHARRFPQQRIRFRALATGAVGALLIGAANLLQAWLTGSVFVPALFVAGGCTLVAGAVLLIQAYRQGEFAEQIARARAETAAERQRRADSQSEQNQR
jgi:CHASE2 domain-containing sensor protein